MLLPKKALLCVVLYFFISAIGHFLYADFLVMVVPSYIPFQKFLIYLIGFLELAGAIGILLPYTRFLAAYCLMALCIAIFSVNINMALKGYNFPEVPAICLYILPIFQIALIAFIAWAMSTERQIRKSNSLIVKSHKTIDGRCQALSVAFSDTLHWYWDERYSLIMAEFTLAQEQAVINLLEDYFEHQWTALNIKKAPAMVITALKNMGGMQLNQTLYASNVVDGGFAFVFVWPWADKKTLSIRLSSFYEHESEQEALARMEKLKTWFTIKPKESGWVKITS